VARHDWVNMGGTIVGSLLMDKLRAVKIDQTQMKKKRQREGCMLYTHVVQESFRFSIHIQYIPIQCTNMQYITEVFNSL